MIIWHLHWRDASRYRDEIYLFETQENAIEYALQTANVQQYIEEGDTEENVRVSLIKGQYPADNSRFYCGDSYFTLEAVPITKKVNGNFC